MTSEASVMIRGYMYRFAMKEECIFLKQSQHVLPSQTSPSATANVPPPLSKLFPQDSSTQPEHQHCSWPPSIKMLAHDSLADAEFLHQEVSPGKDIAQVAYADQIPF
jgi:hypothetical protein